MGEAVLPKRLCINPESCTPESAYQPCHSGPVERNTLYVMRTRFALTPMQEAAPQNLPTNLVIQVHHLS